MLLHNRVSNDELREKMRNDPTPRTTVSFYKYFPVAEPQQFRDALYQAFVSLRVFGRVYIAPEGINGQVSVPTASLDALRSALYASDPALDGVRLNIAHDDDGKSFWVLRMKLRPKIVADGIDDPSFDPSKTGTYLDAAGFNKIAQRDDVVIVDMRNHYEYEVGHFKNAIEIPSDTFREQLPMAADMLRDKKDQPVVMYCTGGIRCEKASAYLVQQGFRDVYHVEGGIIEYVRQAREQGLPVEFVGKNFVFDERMGERITDDVLARCHQCGAPCDHHLNCHNDACHLLFIQCPDCAERFRKCCSAECCADLDLAPGEQRQRRADRAQGEKPFNKSKTLRPKRPEA